jgi:hypothetical protein
MASTKGSRTILLLLLASFWLVSTGCSKDNLREKAEEQAAMFTKLWHPLDGIPTADMSQRTFAFYRKTLLMRSKLNMNFTSTSYDRDNPQMQYLFYSSRPEFVLQFTINNQPSIKLSSADIIPWGFTEKGIISGAQNVVQLYINDENVGYYAGRVPKRLIVTPSKSAGKPYSQFAPNTPLFFRWQPDPQHEVNQLLLRISFYGYGLSIPSKSLLIPDNGFFDAQQVLDTTSSPQVIFRFTRFGGDLINLREGIFVELESLYEYEALLNPAYISNRSDAHFPYPLDSLLEVNTP